MKGSVRMTVHLAKPVDLVKLAAEMARRGLWVAKVLPVETGFEVLSPEPGLVGAKTDGEEVSYKIYSSPDATTLTLFGDAKNFFSKVAEFVGFLAAGGCSEDCISFAELSSSFEAEGACSFGKLKVEGLEEMELKGVVAQGEKETLSLVPLAGDSYLVVYTIRGSWDEVRGRAITLHSLAGRMWEVLKSWTCRQ